MNGRGVKSVARNDAAENTLPLAGLRVGLFGLLLFFLNLQGDGFPLGHNNVHRQLLLVPFTLLFCVLVAALLWPSAISRRIRPHWVEHLADFQPILLLAILFVMLAALLFVAESSYYSKDGYHLHKLVTGLVFAGVLALLSFNLRKRKPAVPQYLLASVLAAYVTAYLLSIWSFPISVWRSDMLPLILESCKSLTTHRDPYHFYTFPHKTLFLTYLPGTLLAFFPAVMMHLDLRFADVFYVVALALIIYQAVRPEHRRVAAALMSLFLLSPYLIYRHEIYTEPHWLSVAACLLLAHRGKWIVAALIVGISMSISQFSWILFPFFILFALERRGLRYGLAIGATAILTASAIILPFIAWSPHAFFYGTLTHWQSIAIDARPVNFSYWTAALLGGTSSLQIIQFILLLGLFVYCAVSRSCATLTGCLRSMSVGLAIFIMFNLLIWGYFFLLLELLLLLYTMSANEWLIGPLDSVPGKTLEGRV